MDSDTPEPDLDGVRKPEPLVVVVILSYCRESDLRECTGSVRKQSYKSIYIIVVDNCVSSPLGSFEDADEVIVSRKNLGWGGGNNIGIVRALAKNAKYTLLLNDDAVLDIDCVANLVRVMEEERITGIVGPIIRYYLLPNRIWHAGSRLDLNTGLSYTRGRGQIDEGQYSELADLFPSGCCMMISNSVIRQVGLLEDKWFMGREEDDINLRIRKAGFKYKIVPKALAWHKVEERSNSKEDDFLRYSNALSTFLLLEKYQGRLAPYRAILVYFISWRGFQRRSVSARKFPLRRIRVYTIAVLDYLRLVFEGKSKTHRITKQWPKLRHICRP